MRAMSRRGFIETGAMSFMLAPGMVRADPQAPPQQQNGAIQGDTDFYHHLTVETFLNGMGPFRFVVDTGADRTVIADDVAQKLGLLSGNQVTVQGISRALSAPTVPLAKLDVGPIVLEDMQVPVLPRGPLGADGYLGLDVVDGRSVTFDFTKQRLTVDNSASDDPFGRGPSGDYAVNVRGVGGRLVAVNCSVDDARAFAFIDTGAEMSIGNTRLFAELQKGGAKFISDAVVPLIGVTGGQIGGKLTLVNRIRFGAVTFQNSVLLIADLPVFDVWGLADKPAALIGMNFLRATSSVTIDYGRKQVLFRIADLLASRRV